MTAKVAVRPLREVASIGAGNSAPKDSRLFQAGKFPFFRTSDVGRVRFGEISSAADYLNEAGVRGLRQFPKGTILFPKSGASTYLNHRVMLNVDGYVSSHLATIVAKKAVLPRYLLYYLSTVRAQDLVQDHAYPSLNLPLIGGIPVPVPSYQEQQRIVAVLDGASAAIGAAAANAERAVQSARELFEARLQSLLLQSSKSWKKKTLKEVSLDFGRGKSKHRPRNDPRLYGGPYPFIQTGDVRASHHLITQYKQTYSEAGLAQSKLWPKGTLCITIAANIAETGILDFDACFPDSVVGVVVDPRQTSNKFLEYLLQSVKSQLKAKGKGSAQDNINLGTFENERFPFPELAVQSAICEELDSLAASVRKLESVYKHKLAALDELKQSLLHQAFSGQI